MGKKHPHKNTHSRNIKNRNGVMSKHTEKNIQKDLTWTTSSSECCNTNDLPPSCSIHLHTKEQQVCGVIYFPTQSKTKHSLAFCLCIVDAAARLCGVRGGGGLGNPTAYGGDLSHRRTGGRWRRREPSSVVRVVVMVIPPRGGSRGLKCI